MSKEFWYFAGAWITGIVAFLAVWIYSFISWGLLVGLMIGWLPALIGGFIIGILWPLVLLAILVIIGLLYF